MKDLNLADDDTFSMLVVAFTWAQAMSVTWQALMMAELEVWSTAKVWRGFVYSQNMIFNNNLKYLSCMAMFNQSYHLPYFDLLQQIYRTR